MGKYYGYVPPEVRAARTRFHRPRFAPLRPRWPGRWAPNVRMVTSSDSPATAARLFRAQAQQHEWRVAYANRRGYSW